MARLVCATLGTSAKLVTAKQILLTVSWLEHGRKNRGELLLRNHNVHVSSDWRRDAGLGQHAIRPVIGTTKSLRSQLDPSPGFCEDLLSLSINAEAMAAVGQNDRLAVSA